MWHLGIMKHKHERGDYYAVHEIFLCKHGKVFGWTQEPMDITGETIEDLLGYIDMISKDCHGQIENGHPILDFDMKPECNCMDEPCDLKELLGYDDVFGEDK